MSTATANPTDARQRAYSLPPESLDPSDPALFVDDSVVHGFERLRHEDPVHRTHSPNPIFDDFCSVTKYNDIMAVDTNHHVFSSD